MSRRNMSRLVWAVAAGVALSGALTGCTSSKPAQYEIKEHVFFPPPPADPRVQFLTHLHGASDFAQRKSSFFEFIVGQEQESYPTVIKPFGVAMLDHKIFVADTVAPRIVVFDLQKRTMEWFGRTGRGVLRKPINVRVGPDRLLYVGDTLRNQVVVFDAAGKYVTEYGDGKQFNPSDLLVTADELYILDNATHGLKVYDLKTRELKRSFGKQGPGAGEFNYPSNMALAPDGGILVCDSMNFRVQKIDPRTGACLLQFGQIGDVPGTFTRPKGIAVDRNGIIYVVDAMSAVLQMFSPEGKLLMHVGGRGIVDGALNLPAQVQIDYDHVADFQQYLDPNFAADYLLLVSNQLERNKVSVFAFGRYKAGIPALTTTPPSAAAKPAAPAPPAAPPGAPLQQPREFGEPEQKK